MLKHILFALLLAPAAVFAQDFVDFEEFDGAATVEKAVLLVPFSSEKYQNREGEYIGRASDMNYEQSVNYFRQSLDSAIISAMKDSCRVISLLTSFTQGTSNDLAEIHSASSYYMADRPVALENEKKQNDLFNRFKLPRKKDKELEELKQENPGEVVSKKEDLSKKFLNVRFSEQDYINSMSMKYGVKYFVFITEFDLVADYSNPYAVAEKNYTRTIKAHFAIFNSEGKFIYGNYETIEFTAKEDNIERICEENLPALAKKIARKIP